MKTHHIHINGIVQGVGLRPMVYKAAKAMSISGHVRNDSDGVHIFFNASDDVAKLFFEHIKANAPAQARIISSQLTAIADAAFIDFSIAVHQHEQTAKQVLISPDTALCADCLREISDIDDRRYRYPFITCTHCGPRYSIVQALPYERRYTTMAPFTMCSACQEEYNDVNNRRFFAQTNSCKECGVKLTMTSPDTPILSNDAEAILSSVKKSLSTGKIVAVKGVGGYLLLCDAGDDEAIQSLRSRKHRPAKPLAVLYPDINIVKRDFEVNDREIVLLTKEECPIVLLQPKQVTSDDLSIKDIAPGLSRVGVMLPSNPLLQLIVADFGKPLIATSANISGSPIIYRDEDAQEHLYDMADHIVHHNRVIAVPLDDSVIEVSKQCGQQIILRRARGYAPSFLSYQSKTKECVLATGAFMKGSFTLAINGNTFISQFLGSGESYESQQMYTDTLEHCLGLYNAKPTIIIADLHPDYFSHQYAQSLAKSGSVEVHFVQHHEAHFAAVLAENDLVQSDEPILGVIWDGTGLGTDGHIWGGEFFKYEHSSLLRCYHFDYLPVIAGDKMALQPRISALCAASDSWPISDKLQEKFTAVEWANYQSLLASSELSTSSVGRIFDAAASLLDICDRQTYEGEAAMYLQALAQKYMDVHGFVMDDSYFKAGSHYYRIPTASLMQGIIMDIGKGKAAEYIAAKFHYSLVCLIGIIANNVQTEKICFSGGVFQNSLLVDWIQHEYSSKFDLYFHKELSPNDENISFGQLVHYENGMTTKPIDINSDAALNEAVHQELEKIEHP